jgi:hypothetical protein
MRKTYVLIAAAVVASLVIFFLLYAHTIRTSADSLVRNSYLLSNYEGDSLSLATVQQQYDEKLEPTPDCTDSFCTYEVVVTNRFLAAFRLVPYTEIRSVFWVRDGEVIENMLNYMTTVDHRYNVVAHSAIQFGDKGHLFYLDPWGGAAPLNSNGLATISYGSSSEKKRMVLGLNTACLTKLGGCGSVAELLPTIWERAPNDLIKCRIASDKGMVEAPPSWRSYGN